MDPNKYEYNLQSMSRDKSKSLLLGKLSILLHGEIVVGEVAVGEISDWGS